MIHSCLCPIGSSQLGHVGTSVVSTGCIDATGRCLLPSHASPSPRNWVWDGPVRFPEIAYTDSRNPRATGHSHLFIRFVLLL